VQAVVQELRGEKIDIIPWSKDAAKFACNALAPARVSKVYINEEDTSMEIVVNDDQLSLAIGKKGQNVRLASRLTCWKIDIKSEAEVEKTSRKVIDDLTENLRINEILARVLFDEYLRDARDIARLTPEELAKVTRISVEDCKAIIDNAKAWAEALEKQAAELAALESQAQETEKAEEAEEAGKTGPTGTTSTTTEQAPTEG
jgi:N utilization substance protein A